MVIVIFLIVFAYVPICMSLICRKIGYSPAVGFLAVVPYFGSLFAIVLLWFLAFSKWPRWQDAGLE
jgi:hypothetical protein